MLRYDVNMRRNISFYLLKISFNGLLFIIVGIYIYIIAAIGNQDDLMGKVAKLLENETTSDFVDLVQHNNLLQ